MDIRDTLSCGQCFRFETGEDGYARYVCGTDESVRCLEVFDNNTGVIYSDPFWRKVFDADTDYESIKKSLAAKSPVFEQAISYAPGIVILNQDPWEAFCSFIISQNNNIPRIKSTVEKLCNAYGKTGQGGIHGFPGPGTLASVPVLELRSLGLGFRDVYVSEAAKKVADGSLDLENLKKKPLDEAFATLTSLKGVGTKVASCTLLFGLHRLECFPRDVWIKRIVNEFFPGWKDEDFGPFAGIAQQFLFHWARTSDIFEKKENKK